MMDTRDDSTIRDMNRNRQSRILRNLFKLLLPFGLLAFGLFFPAPVRGQDVPPIPSLLTMAPIRTHAVGERITVVVDLAGQEDRPQTNKMIKLYIDGELVRRARTDESGRAEIRVSEEFAVGDYIVTAVFEGTEAYRGSEASRSLTIRPILLEIELIPPLPGIQFTLDDQPFFSGADGVARIEVDKIDTYRLEVLVPDEPLNDDTTIAFDRWRGPFFEPVRELEVSADTQLQVGFALYHPISLSFFDLQGRPVPTERLESVTLRSSHSVLHTWEEYGQHWLQASRIARRKEGLEVTPVQYGVESVIIDGASVVNKYQQRFMVEPKDVWPVELLLYSVRVKGIDALFGFPVGTGVELQYPDGSSQILEYGPDNEIFVDSRARGAYIAQVMGVGGMAPPTPISVSKDQDVTLKVLTTMDMIVAVVAGTVGALGLLFFGRPFLLTLPIRLFQGTWQLIRSRRSGSPAGAPAVQPGGKKLRLPAWLPGRLKRESDEPTAI